MIGTLFDLLLVIAGFGLIIIVHELGHFLAAKWAGIRVLAFAVGFGPAIASYRKGLGWRRGSTEPEYRSRGKPDDLSPTEYRFNALLLGGYVKMLGQEDLNPGAVSDAPDSYQNCPAWKRMIVISVGVGMNIACAAVLFIVVFLAGLQMAPPIIGLVIGPADTAVAINAEALHLDDPHLLPGDTVVRVNGREADSFNDIHLASAMSERGEPVDLLVRREGVEDLLHFAIVPEESPVTGLLAIGVFPARSPQIFEEATAEQAASFASAMADLGIEGVHPGMRLTRVGSDTSITGAFDLREAFDASGGEPVEVVFVSADGERASGAVRPIPALMQATVPTGEDSTAMIDHVLGLAPVMMVARVSPDMRGYKLGLREGDIFVRVGAIEYPTMADGVRVIRDHNGREVEVVVLRGGQYEELSLPVLPNGTIGFNVTDTSRTSTLLAAPPEPTETDPHVAPAHELIDAPGARIVAVDDRAVSNLGQVRMALIDATRRAHNLQQASVTVPITIEPPGGGEPEAREWTLTRTHVSALHELGWLSPISMASFEPLMIPLRADGPFDAIMMGLSETKSVMITTYATFERLFAGTVKIEHLKGPVGIAHLGTQIADRGLIWLMFFMALISVNLAVINFLPLPIVDGGQFVLLLIEQATGRPVPVQVQNALSMAGLLLIGAVFLLVTFNDIKAIFGI